MSVPKTLPRTSGELVSSEPLSSKKYILNITNIPGHYVNDMLRKGEKSIKR